MPQLADLTIKKADGTTDITYTGVVPSAGDKSPAVWRANSVGSSIGQRPELRMVTSQNGNNTSRKVNIQFSYPSLLTDSNTGRVTVENRFNFTLTGAIPVDMTDLALAEAVNQGFNLVASELIKSAAVSGYAPT